MFILSTLSIRADLAETHCWGISCLLGQTWGHGNDCLYVFWLFNLGASTLLLSFFPFNLSSSLLLCLQFLSRAIALLNHYSIELGWFSASINLLLIVAFMFCLNSSISGHSSYLLLLTTFSKSCTNSSIVLPPCSILFNSATFADSSSPPPNYFLIFNKNSPTDLYPMSPASKSSIIFSF